MAVPVMVLFEFPKRPPYFSKPRVALCDMEGNIQIVPRENAISAMSKDLIYIANNFEPADKDRTFMLFEAYRARQKLMGTLVDDFEIDGNCILLKKVYLSKGTYTIPEFVSGIYNGQPLQSPFSECEELKLYNASSVRRFDNMFACCHNLRCLDLSAFDTSKVVSMRRMFAGCDSLEWLDVSGFDTSNVINMSNMFDDCRRLTSLHLSNFNTANVVTMDSMFYRCFNLHDLDVSSFDIRSVFCMNDMFRYLIKLQSLDLRNFGKNKCCEFTGMFGDCCDLTMLNMPNMPVLKKAYVDNMFTGCTHRYDFAVHPSLKSRLTSWYGR